MMGFLTGNNSYRERNDAPWQSPLSRPMLIESLLEAATTTTGVKRVYVIMLIRAIAEGSPTIREVYRKQLQRLQALPSTRDYLDDDEALGRR